MVNFYYIYIYVALHRYLFRIHRYEGWVSGTYTYILLCMAVYMAHFYYVYVAIYGDLLMSYLSMSLAYRHEGVVSG